MPTLPGNALGYQNYSNSPDEAIDAEGKIFRGQLMFDAARKLRYVVIMWRTETAAPEVVWASGPEAGSGGLCESPFRGLRAVYNAAQGVGASTVDATIPQYTPYKLPAAVPGPKGDPGPQGPKGDPGPAGSGGGLTEDDRRRLGWLATWLAPLLGG